MSYWPSTRTNSYIAPQSNYYGVANNSTYAGGGSTVVNYIINVTNINQGGYNNNNNNNNNVNININSNGVNNNNNNNNSPYNNNNNNNSSYWPSTRTNSYIAPQSNYGCPNNSYSGQGTTVVNYITNVTNINQGGYYNNNNNNVNINVNSYNINNNNNNNNYPVYGYN